MRRHHIRIIVIHIIVIRIIRHTLILILRIIVQTHQVDVSFIMNHSSCLVFHTLVIIAVMTRMMAMWFN